MTLMKDKARDDTDAREFTQGSDLDEEERFTFFGLERPDGKTVDAAFASSEDVQIEYGSAPYTPLEPDYSKLREVLPNFERDLERFELERDKLKDRYTHAWNQGDIVSYLALEAKWQELNGFLKGLNVLKEVLRHWQEYEWGEMDISNYYQDEIILEPTHRAAAQKKFDLMTSRAIQILARQQNREQDPS
jgi:hypothetical protein